VELAIVMHGINEQLTNNKWPAAADASQHSQLKHPKETGISVFDHHFQALELLIEGLLVRVQSGEQ